MEYQIVFCLKTETLEDIRNHFMQNFSNKLTRQKCLKTLCVSAHCFHDEEMAFLWGVTWIRLSEDSQLF